MAEVDTAAAMMALAKYTREPDLIRRYKDVAVRSYQSSMDLIVITSLRSEEERYVWDQLDQIRRWLEAEGLLQRWNRSAVISPLDVGQPESCGRDAAPKLRNCRSIAAVGPRSIIFEISRGSKSIS